METARVLSRLSLVPLLLAGFALPLSAAADPWKDESGKGRKHAQWKDRDGERGKGRDKAVEQARKQAEKRWEKRIEDAEKRRGWAGGDGERNRVEVGRHQATSPRVVPAPTRRAAAGPSSFSSRPQQRPTNAFGRSPAPRLAAAPSSTDARRRAAVSDYMSRHPGG